MNPLLRTTIVTIFLLLTISLFSQGDVEVDGKIKVNKILTSTAPVPNTLYGNTMPIAYGSISENGNIGSSYGISSVSKTATGVYEITINLPTLSSNPVVIITPFSGLEPETAGYNSISNTKFQAKIYKLDGTLTDSAFSFVVFGDSQ